MRGALVYALLSLFSIAADAAQPGFDCTKALTSTEHVICNNEILSALDAQMGAIFVKAKDDYPQEVESLMQSQKSWLRARQTDCPVAKVQAECLQSLYKERIQALKYPLFLPPLTAAKMDHALAALREMDAETLNAITVPENRDSLGEISCRFFETDPKAARKLFDAHFGSSKDGWTPLCRSISIVKRVPEMAAFVDTLSGIQGERTSCDGTMRIAFDRQEAVLEIMAAVDIHPEKHKQRAERLSILQRWAEYGNWEKREYAALKVSRSIAADALRRYYQRQFHLDAAQAQNVADEYIQQFVDTYITQHMGASLASYRSLASTREDVDAYLRGEQAATDTIQLSSLLGLAIVNDYPVASIQALVQAGAKLGVFPYGEGKNAPMHDSALMLAAPRPEVIALLLKAGADPNDGNGFGKTALMYAIQERNLESIKLLLAAHADVNAKTHAEAECMALSAGLRTPLMYAVWEATPAIVKLLLDAHADSNAKDTKGKTALDYLQQNTTASAAERQEITEMLQTTQK